MPQSLRETAEGVFDHVFAELHVIAKTFELLEGEVFRASGLLSEEEVGRVRPHIVRSLQRLEHHAFAIGVVLEANVVSGAPFWLGWIERMSDGTIQDDSNIRYPWRGSFYEYESSPWMERPRESGVDSVVGPYVDFDKYLITLSSPIVIGDRFIGVAAADIHLHDYERLVAIPLSRIRTDCMICNGEGRVVVSNSSSQAVGSIHESASSADTQIGHYDWRVVSVS